MHAITNVYSFKKGGANADLGLIKLPDLANPPVINLEPLLDESAEKDDKGDDNADENDGANENNDGHGESLPKHESEGRTTGTADMQTTKENYEANSYATRRK